VPGPHGRVLGIPVATVESVVAAVETNGHLPRPYLGVRLQPLWIDDDTRTRLGRRSRVIAAVGGVDQGSPAEQAGVQLGDLLLTIGAEPIEHIRELAARIAALPVGQSIPLEVLRGGRPLSLEVTVAERPRAQTDPKSASDACESG
jgi:S1-C subfamily serine protease